MKKEIEKLRKQIEKLKNDNQSMWELQQQSAKDLKSNQKSNNTSAELQGEVQMLNKAIIQHKNKESQFDAITKVINDQNDLLKKCAAFYADESNWKVLVDDDSEYPLISRSDEEVINGRARGGKRARMCLDEIEKMSKE
jgi:hypothetical protein